MTQTAYDSVSFPGKKPNVIRELLKAGKPTRATRVFSSWPLITEIVGNTGKYDYIEFSIEYAPIDQYNMEHICRAAELHKMGTIVKVDMPNRTFVAQKCLAAGCQGILFTDHREAKDVEATIKSILADSPVDGGGYGYNMRRFIGYSTGFTQMQFVEMLQDVVNIFMIEKKEAVDNIDEICAVPGVDMIQFGPSDFSMSCGVNSRDNGDNIRAAEEKCIKAALKNGVRPRCEIMSAEGAKRYIDLGVKDFNISGELWMLSQMWGRHADELNKILEDAKII